LLLQEKVSQADEELAFTGCSNSVATLADNTKIYVTENAGVVKTPDSEYYTIIPFDDSLNVAGRTALVTAATKKGGTVSVDVGKIVFDADVSTGTRATLTGFKLTDSTNNVTVTCAGNDNMGSGSDKLLAFCAGVTGANAYTVMIAEQ
jgi:hypothetical protein